MSHLGIAASAGLLMGTLLLAPSAMVDEPPMCNGKAATIVGGHDDYVIGTEGDDVIVTTDASYVTAGAGDDTVCVLGTYATGLRVAVDEGDDYVDARAYSGETIAVRLGPGADRYLGSPRRDSVDADDEGPGIDDLDTVDTGAGLDLVTTGVGGQPVMDVVHLGADRDWLRYAGIPAGSVLDGGTDSDQFVLEDVGRSWSFDQSTGRLTLSPGQQALTLTGFQQFFFNDADFVHFRGGMGSESISSRGRLVAVMGGGNDTVASSVPQLADVRGGSGRDLVSIERDYGETAPRDISARVDLTADRVVISGQVSDTALIEAEGVVVRGIRRVRVLGDERANRVTVVSVCDVRIAGGRGEDHLRVEDHDDCGVATRVTGGEGADHLLGGKRRDVLLGGPGRDLADGRMGRDRCIAEVRRSCER